MNVKTNAEQCLKVGLRLKELPVRAQFLCRPFLKKTMPDETKAAMLFYAVAICHQTRALKSETMQLFGWEYIEDSFLKLAEINSWLLDPKAIIHADLSTIKNALAVAFSDHGLAEQSTLDRLGERSILMKDTSTLVLNEADGSFIKLLQQTNSFLINNGKGYYEILSKCDTFSDPMRKKSSFLAKLLMDAGLFSIRDNHHYIPIMDYHMQRVLLRLGCVEILSESLKKSLQNREPLPTDAPVRQACIEAINLISTASGTAKWQMNDYFWTLGRSCCDETTLCHDKHCAKHPCSFESIISVSDHKHCSFKQQCKGYRDITYRMLREPMVNTHFY